MKLLPKSLYVLSSAMARAEKLRELFPMMSMLNLEFSAYVSPESGLVYLVVVTHNLDNVGRQIAFMVAHESYTSNAFEEAPAEVVSFVPPPGRFPIVVKGTWESSVAATDFADQWIASVRTAVASISFPETTQARIEQLEKQVNEINGILFSLREAQKAATT